MAISVGEQKVVFFENKFSGHCSLLLMSFCHDVKVM